MKKTMGKKRIIGMLSAIILFGIPCKALAVQEVKLEAEPVFVGESITIDEEPIVEFRGAITEKDDYQEYYYTAPRDGRYSFEQQLLTANTRLESSIYDELGNGIGSLWGTGQRTIELQEGVSYTIKVPKYQNDLTQYIISIKGQEPTTDITQITEVHDQISFIDQKNIYMFTTSVDGYYRFDIDDTPVNSKFGLLIWDSNETNILDCYYGTSGELIYLDAGETYQIQVRYRNSLGKYTLHVYAQKEQIDISGYTVIEDSIEFNGQYNYYSFTSIEEGTYSFNLNGLKTGNSADIHIWDEEGEKVSQNYNHDHQEVLLYAGEKYSVCVAAGKGKSGYSLQIGYPEGVFSKYSVVQNNNETNEGDINISDIDVEALLEENQRLKAELEELQSKYDLLTAILGDSGLNISDED